MPFTEKRGDRYRVRWRLPDGSYTSASRDEYGEPFLTEEAARAYGLNQEADIRRGLFKDPRAGQITFAEWAESWYATLDLERSTMQNYRNMLRSHVMATFGHLALSAIKPAAVAMWERGIVQAGYAPRTAYDARSVLITVLAAAVRAGHIDTNPAERVRGTGRKGRRRVQAWERAEKAWSTPLDALLIGERAALLSGRWQDLLLVLLGQFTGARWSEAIALTPEAVADRGIVHLHWKVYEDDHGRFYWGRPKDGSIRDVHVPVWLWEMLRLAAAEAHPCDCTVPKDAPHDPDAPWCAGGRRMLFLGEQRHHRRSTFARLVLRPAADGWFPANGSKPARPVLADCSKTWPGIPLSPWPAATPGEPWEPPKVVKYRQGRQPHAIGSRATRAELVAYALSQGANPLLAEMSTREALLDAYVRPSRDALVSWGPVRKDLTYHGLRHGQQTMMDSAGIKPALKTARMGHMDTTMAARYGHVTDAMVDELLDLLDGAWETALQRRFELCPRSSVRVLDEALAGFRGGVVTPLFSQSSPKTSRARLSG